MSRAGDLAATGIRRGVRNATGNARLGQEFGDYTAAALGFLAPGTTAKTVNIVRTLRAGQGASKLSTAVASARTSKITVAALDLATTSATTRYSITRHALSRKIERQVRSIDEIDAIRNPLKITPIKIDIYGRPSQRFIGINATVAINPETGRIVSVNPTSSKVIKTLRSREKK